MKENLESRVQRLKSEINRQPTLKELEIMAAKKANAAATPATPAKEAAPAKEVDPNSVPLASICKEIGISGQVARRKLRAAKLSKDGRWAWNKDSPELKKVRELLSPKAREASAA
jgi:hypothetical protein